MNKGTVLNIRNRWACRICDYKQETVREEEWPKHCNKIMKMISTFGLRMEDNA